jgi:uncharacterized protein YceK
VIRKLFLLFTVVLLSGCATVTPIREKQSLGNPQASLISITSSYEASLWNKNAVLPGKIYIDSVFYGEFSSSQREFSAEVLPGTRLIVVCPYSEIRCINAQVNVQPNKNYRYHYTQIKEYRVVMLNYVWKLIPLDVQDYFPISQTNNRSTSISNPPANNVTPAAASNNSNPSKNIEDQMNSAKIRCESLGFKAGTQSFGECILRLTQ